MTLAIIFAFFVATAGTWLMIRLAPTLKLVDKPNERSSHSRPTARGGGLAIVATVSIAGLSRPGEGADLSALLLFSLPIATLGLIDDRVGLSVGIRLGVQLVTSIGFVLAAAGSASGMAGAIASALAIAWACNLFNFMDGIDGMAGTEAVFICGVSAWLVWAQDPALAAALCVVAASCAGFLLWNWSPARIFMGDVGSAYLGFLIAAFAYTTVIRGLVALPVWITLWSLFIADTSVTLLRRVVRREKWWTAHRTHAYQHLNALLKSHAKVTCIYSATNLIIVTPAAWFAHSHAYAAWWTCGLLLSALMAIAWLIGAGTRRAVA